MTVNEKIKELIEEKAIDRLYFSEGFKEALEKGFKAFLDGKKEKDNPYKLSGHERDTTYDDECNYLWYSGFWAAYNFKTKQT